MNKCSACDSTDTTIYTDLPFDLIPNQYLCVKHKKMADESKNHRLKIRFEEHIKKAMELKCQNNIICVLFVLIILGVVAGLVFLSYFTDPIIIDYLNNL